jgi:hypothetical protein
VIWAGSEAQEVGEKVDLRGSLKVGAMAIFVVMTKRCCSLIR